MRRPRNPATMVHSLSCTDTEWEQVRERADAAGLSMSRYLVERALTLELPRDGDGKLRAPPRLVLSEGEQRECCPARGLRADRRDKLLKLLDTGGQNCTPNNKLMALIDEFLKSSRRKAKES